MAGRSFADIYEQWERTHDESAGISRRASSDEKHHYASNNDESINAIRKMNAQDELDLHEMTLENAVRATESFLDSSYERGLRKVRIITGKGLHSKNGEAILRPAITEVCNSSPKVREVFVPKASEGGSGALTVILKSRHGSNGR